MTGWEGVGAGARAVFRRARVVVVLYAVSLAFSFPFAVAVADLASRFADHSLVSERVAAARDVTLLIDFFVTHRDPLLAIGAVLGASLPLLILAGWFFDGAILATSRESRTAGLVGEGARVFGRLLRLVPLSLAFAVSVLGPLGSVAYVLGVVMVDDWTDPRWVMAVQLSAVAGVLGVGVWVKGTVEIMRAIAASADVPSARSAFLRGIRYGLRRPQGVLIAAGTWVLAWVCLLPVVALIDPALDKSSTVAVVASLVFHQVAALVRAGLRVGLLSSMAELVAGARSGG